MRIHPFQSAFTVQHGRQFAYAGNKATSKATVQHSPVTQNRSFAAVGDAFSGVGLQAKYALDLVGFLPRLGPSETSMLTIAGLRETDLPIKIRQLWNEESCINKFNKEEIVQGFITDLKSQIDQEPVDFVNLFRIPLPLIAAINKQIQPVHLIVQDSGNIPLTPSLPVILDNNPSLRTVSIFDTQLNSLCLPSDSPVEKLVLGKGAKIKVLDLDGAGIQEIGFPREADKLAGIHIGELRLRRVPAVDNGFFKEQIGAIKFLMSQGMKMQLGEQEKEQFLSAISADVLI